MSRLAAERGFQHFLEETINTTRDEFSVERVLQGSGFQSGGRFVDILRKNSSFIEEEIVRPELQEYQTRTNNQFQVLLDAVENGDSIDMYQRELLQYDNYLDALAEDVSEQQQSIVVQQTMSRLEELAEGIQPIVQHSNDEFWDATTAALESDEALYLVEEAFPFTGPFQEHKHAFTFETTIDPADVVGSLFGRGLPTISVEFTDEAVRALQEAEQQITNDLRNEIQRRYTE